MQLENWVYRRTLLFAQQFFMKSTEINFRTSGLRWGESAVDTLHEGYVINVITACCYTSNKYISSHGFKCFMLSSPKQCLMHNTHTHTYIHHIYIYIFCGSNSWKAACIFVTVSQPRKALMCLPLLCIVPEGKQRENGPHQAGDENTHLKQSYIFHLK